MIILNQGINEIAFIKMLNHVTWILRGLLSILKLKIFARILLMMLKKDLIHQIMRSIDHWLQEKTKKVIGLMKDKLGGKIMTESPALRPKTYSYLMDDSNTDTGTHAIMKSKRNKKMCNKKNT